MLDDGHSATERLALQDEVIAAFLRDGLRPVEIAVRMGIPVSEVHARIERMNRRGSGEPVAPPSGPARPPEPEDEHETATPTLSRTPVALLGGVVLAFAVAITAFIATAGGGDDGRDRPRGQQVPPVVIGQPTPVKINGLVFEPVTLGAPVPLEPNVALLVMRGCVDCELELAWYVQGPDGLEELPVAMPPGLTNFGVQASLDGDDLIATGRMGEDFAVVRSRDGGANWVELWRGSEPVRPAYAGPEHVLLMVDTAPPITGNLRVLSAVLVPGGAVVNMASGTPPPQTPWSVDLQIRKHPRGQTGTVNEDGTRSFSPVSSSQNRRGNMVALYDDAGRLLKGWYEAPAFPSGALLGNDAYVAGFVDLAGEFVLHDEDEGPYPGEFRVTPTLFDTLAGTVHRLDLGLDPELHSLVLGAIRGPFARLIGDGSACLPVAESMSEAAATFACVAPGTLVVDLGEYAGTPDGALRYRIRVPGAVEGWVPAEGVRLLGAR